jgi:acetyltransferase-like isoleucine patch superfamily enzyme
VNEIYEKDYEIMIQKKMARSKKSKYAMYLELFVGKPGFWSFLKYEFITLFGGFPGAGGIFLRNILYKHLFKKVGKGVIFGKSITVRNPYKITIGSNVIIDENVMLDAKGLDNEGITIKDGVYIGRNSIISCKNGDIILNDGVDIGFNCEIYSLSRVEIGENTLIAAYTYVVGGGHLAGELDTLFKDQQKHARGIKIGKNVWLGAKSIVMDGCDIGSNSIIGAGAIVTKKIPSYSIAVGMPAEIIKDRKKEIKKNKKTDKS